jgi:hypothetical protein
MAKKVIAVLLTLSVVLIVGHFKAQAQSGAVAFLGAAPGTTLASNCPASPTTPSICVVAGGVYLWQSSSTGWFLPQPASIAVVGVQKINGVAPGSTGNVTLACPGTTAATPVTVSPAVSATGATATVTATGSLPALPVTTTCTATGS